MIDKAIKSIVNNSVWQPGEKLNILYVGREQPFENPSHDWHCIEKGNSLEVLSRDVTYNVVLATTPTVSVRTLYSLCRNLQVPGVFVHTSLDVRSEAVWPLHKNIKEYHNVFATRELAEDMMFYDAPIIDPASCEAVEKECSQAMINRYFKQGE